MGSVIPVFAAIFMILGSIGALFSAFLGVFMVAAILLLFSAAFFIVFSVTGKKSKTVIHQAFKDDFPAEQASGKQPAYVHQPPYKDAYVSSAAYRQETAYAPTTAGVKEKPVLTDAKSSQPIHKKEEHSREKAAQPFVPNKAEPAPAFRQGPSAAREEKFMRYCKSCGFIGSQLSTEAVPPCPKCGNLLSSTMTTLDQFTAMSIERRKATVKSWMSV